jgi:hypothetical protein
MDNTKHKRGDLSSCGKLRFWQYQSYLNKNTGRKAERWIPAEEFEQYRSDYIARCQISAAQSDFRKMQREKTK